jgi:hypothetical protein
MKFDILDLGRATVETKGDPIVPPSDSGTQDPGLN